MPQYVKLDDNKQFKLDYDQSSKNYLTQAKGTKVDYKSMHNNFFDGTKSPD